MKNYKFFVVMIVMGIIIESGVLAQSSGDFIFEQIPMTKAVMLGVFLDNPGLTIATLVGYTGDAAKVEIPSNCVITIPEKQGTVGSTKPLKVVAIENAFMSYQRLTSVVIPSTVKIIGINAFNGCTSLTSIAIPNSVTKIGVAAFRNCKSLTSISIPTSVTEIERNAFSLCNDLTSITIPNNVKKIGAGAFMQCSNLKSIAIPDSVNEFGMQSFSGCTNLASIDLPNSITKIDTGMFKDCTSLKSIKIPKSVSAINKGAFSGCSSLAKITLEDGAMIKIAKDAFKGVPTLDEQTQNALIAAGYKGKF
ncbi:MAG: hypothetical protein Ta2F_14220 [Termitinemataceae bacterium]|nr:MAG: hypothetical protein Ta2F_14220 [Termitinemataceae bacterium]